MLSLAAWKRFTLNESLLDLLSKITREITSSSIVLSARHYFVYIVLEPNAISLSLPTYLRPQRPKSRSSHADSNYTSIAPTCAGQDEGNPAENLTSRTYHNHNKFSGAISHTVHTSDSSVASSLETIYNKGTRLRRWPLDLP